MKPKYIKIVFEHINFTIISNPYLKGLFINGFLKNYQQVPRFQLKDHAVHGNVLQRLHVSASGNVSENWLVLHEESNEEMHRQVTHPHQKLVRFAKVVNHPQYLPKIEQTNNYILNNYLYRDQSQYQARKSAN